MDAFYASVEQRDKPALLETVFLVHHLPAWSRNLCQRLVKASKVHLGDIWVIKSCRSAINSDLSR
jgi:hypothetical protein